MSSALATVDSSAKQVPRERSEHDWYVEPEEAVEGLFRVQRFEGWIYDPACGGGNILKVAARHGHPTIGSDIVYRGAGVGRHNFARDGGGMLSERPFRTDNAIFNPPFALSEDFLRHALTVARRKVALLQRVAFLEGRVRRWIFERTPLAAVHPFSWRISMPPGGLGIKPTGGAVAFAWFIWDHTYPIGRPPIIRRIEAVT